MCPGPSPVTDTLWRSLVFLNSLRQLRAVGTTGAKRNVLKRFERVALLKKRGQCKEGDRVSGLRKTKPEA